MGLDVRRVAVIGAGAAGLVCIKTCLEEGLEPVCFEKSGQIGGVWVTPQQMSDDPNGPGRVYDGMITNVSKELMCYADFAFPRESTPYLKVNEVVKYIDDYARNFDLLGHIQFNTKVLKVKQTEDFETSGQWTVCTKHNGHTKTQIFDAIMVCTGMYSSGSVPKDPGADEFRGQILHSCQFRSSKDFKDKRVLVVGSSHSAGDIASVCSDHAKQVALSLRNGAWIVPRIMDRRVMGTIINQRWRDHMPAWLAAPLIKKKMESLLDTEGLGIQGRKHPLKSSIMVSDTLPIKIMSGTIGVRSGIRRFERTKVIFEDGSEMADVDTVIYATGYTISTPFIEESILSNDFRQLDLYMHFIPPRLKHKTMAAIGFFATRGSTMPTSELQAQFAVQMFRGKLELPSLPDMMRDIGFRRDKLFRQYGKYRPVIVPTKYNDELARLIGALPNFWKLLFTDPELALKFYFGPAYPESYRLVGPYARPSAREDFLRSGEDLMHGITLQTVRSDALKAMSSSGAKRRSHLVFLVVVCALAFIFLYVIR